nr:NigD-like C-terminal domain-containing protein [uncultured Carboxylicivirga sp.]
MKLKNLMYIAPFVLVVILSSCMKDIDSTPYTYSNLCITSLNGDYYLFTSDFGEVYASKSLPDDYDFEVDKRVMLSFSTYTESTEADYDYLVLPSSIIDISTSDIIYINEENKDTLGNDGVLIKGLFAQGNYLNVDFAFGASGAKSHYFNTSFDSELQTSNDTVTLTFHHKDNDDVWLQSYSGFMSFDLRSLGEDEPQRPYVLTIISTKTTGTESKNSIKVED